MVKTVHANLSHLYTYSLSPMCKWDSPMCKWDSPICKWDSSMCKWDRVWWTVLTVMYLILVFVAATCLVGEHFDVGCRRPQPFYLRASSRIFSTSFCSLGIILCSLCHSGFFEVFRDLNPHHGHWLVWKLGHACFLLQTEKKTWTLATEHHNCLQWPFLRNQEAFCGCHLGSVMWIYPYVQGCWRSTALSKDLVGPSQLCFM